MSGQEKGHKTKIILASASPRRRQIFEIMGLEFEVIIPVGCREECRRDPCSMVILNSIAKAKNVFAGQESRKIELSSGKKDFRLLISSFDTIVSIGNRILGKPSNPEEAYGYIKLLSGRVHRVVSGVCILDSSTGKYECSSGITQVWFRDITGNEIRNYISQGDAMDKAGAYNINGPGSIFVKKIKGCFFNVAGVPVFEYIELLKKFNYKIL